MSEIVESVNRIVAHFTQAKKAYEARDNRDKAIEMSQHEAALRAFIRDYERLDDLTRPIPIVHGEDLSDLPKALLAELSVAKTDDLENQIVTVINAAGKEADIDTILIYLYRKFEVTQTRRYLQNKLWRMVQKQQLFSLPGKKGHYTTVPQEPDDPFKDDWSDEEASQASPPESHLDDDIPF